MTCPYHRTELSCWLQYFAGDSSQESGAKEQSLGRFQDGLLCQMGKATMDLQWLVTQWPADWTRIFRNESLIPRFVKSTQQRTEKEPASEVESPGGPPARTAWADASCHTAQKPVGGDTFSIRLMTVMQRSNTVSWSVKSKGMKRSITPSSSSCLLQLSPSSMITILHRAHSFLSKHGVPTAYLHVHMKLSTYQS